MTGRHDEHWDDVWREKDLPDWDYLSQVILGVLKKEALGLTGKKVLEAGSGSGRISLKASEEGASVYLLDNSPEAIDFSKKLFLRKGRQSDITCASLFDMPYQSDSFDLVWNAGVIEHFTGDVQLSALKEMVRVCKRGGFVITLNPYAGSILHTVGKFLIEKMAKYPFGEEIPIKTLKDKGALLGCELYNKEYSIGFIVLFVGMFKRLTLLPMGFIFKPILAILNYISCGLDSSFLGGALRRMDLLFSKLFGGYLLVSVFKKS